MVKREPFRARAHTEASRFLKEFVQLIEGYAENEAVQSAHSALPDTIRQGRTLREMALDDIADAMAVVMQHVPAADVPKDFYHRILTMRSPGVKIDRATSDQYLEDHLRDVGERLRTEKIVPDFIVPLTNSLPEQVRHDFQGNWVGLISHLHTLTLGEGAVVSRNNMNALTRGFNEAVAAKLEEHTRWQRAVETSTKLLSADQDNKKLAAHVPADIEKATNSAIAIQNEVYTLRKKREQIDVRLAELGEKPSSRVDELRLRVGQSAMSDEARAAATRELERMATLQPASPDFGISENYVEWLTALPWQGRTALNTDIAKAAKILDDSHFGMTRVKQEILEYIAALDSNPDIQAPVLCLVGPPGVGKTSIAKSIAEAMNCAMVKAAMGGADDVSKIRGHRRTYIGAMPGEIITAMRKSGVADPLMLLDEIDKIKEGARGNPQDALLEALDPSQNRDFRDEYLGVGFDLSKVKFIATANTELPGPLFDRMRVIRLDAYTIEEKLEIAKRHLLPRQMAELKLVGNLISDEALRDVITKYTREAGVRNLEQKLGALCRKVNIALKTDPSPTRVTCDNLPDYLGPPLVKPDWQPKEDMVGLVNGLAYTSVGGCLLPIETMVLESNGFKIGVSGNIKTVMSESARVAERVVRSMAPKLGLTKADLERKEVHVHVPDGATPKDGPSAGLAFATSIVSALTDIPVRRDIAMTGELIQHGLAFPIGGLQQKIEAAVQAKLTTVLVPKANEGDLAKVPESIRKQIEIVPVETIEDVLKLALVRNPFVIPTPAPAVPPMLHEQNGVIRLPEPPPMPQQHAPVVWQQAPVSYSLSARFGGSGWSPANSDQAEKPASPARVGLAPV